MLFSRPRTLIAAASCAFLLACGGGGFRIKSPAPTKGEKLKTVEHRSLDMTLEGDTPLGPMKLSVANSIDLDVTSEVLELDGERPTSLKLAFGPARAAVKVSLQGLDEEKELPFAGKTYVVRFLDDKAKVEAEDGSPIDPETQQFLEEKGQAVISEGGITKCLPQGALAVGIEVDLAGCAETLHLPQEFKVETATLTLTEIGKHEGRESATFDLVLKIAGKAMGAGSGGAPGMSIDASGKLVVDAATGHALLIDMKGPIAVSSEERGLKMTGTGNFAMTQKNSIL